MTADTYGAVPSTIAAMMGATGRRGEPAGGCAVRPGPRARRPEQLDPIGEIDGWHINEASKRDIDAILKRCIKDPVSPEFMAPPVTRP